MSGPPPRVPVRVPVRWSALRVRLAVAALAVLATALVPHPGFVFVVLATVGGLAAVVAPAYAGAFGLIVVEVVGWALAYGADATPALLRTTAFALALYLLHAATSLAATVPVAADLEPGVPTAWFARCLPGVVAAALAGAVVGLLGRPQGSIALDIAGMAAVVTVLALLVRASRNLDRRESS